MAKKPIASKELSETGKQWGDFLYAFFIKQASEYRTKDQYDRSHVILKAILNEKTTIREIGKNAVDGALSLQRNLMSKERYFARHCCLGIHMSMEAMTTSPVESMHDLIKMGEME